MRHLRLRASTNDRPNGMTRLGIYGALLSLFLGAGSHVSSQSPPPETHRANKRASASHAPQPAVRLDDTARDLPFDGFDAVGGGGNASRLLLN